MNAAQRYLSLERDETMTIKEGTIVSHEGAQQWGAGKVLAVTPFMVTIRFSDGKDRKIAASHFGTLHSADASLYVPPPVAAPEPARSAARKSTKVKKLL